MIKRLTTDSFVRLRRFHVLVGIIIFAWGTVLLFTILTPSALRRADDFFYDLFYRLRPETDMQGKNGDIVLVAADEESLVAVDNRFHFGWPWPREFWGHIATYLDKAGARALVFDIVFVQTSAYSANGDDDTFSESLNKLKTPIVFGAGVKPPAPGQTQGTWERFAPTVKNPSFGAVNVGNEKIYRKYLPTVYGQPSVAVSTLKQLHADAKIPTTAPFLLHYYGPHQGADGKTTFPFIRAVNVLGAQIDSAKGATYSITPDLFKDKIVILCGTAKGTFDLKTSPLSDEYPGPEVQATAIENLLRGEMVRPVAAGILSLMALMGASLVSAGVIIPRRATIKLLAPILCTIILFALAIALFRGTTIHWLSPVQPLLSIAIATPLAFAWTYFAEDRQRRFMLKALSKVVSPAVAEQLARDPQRLARATTRTDITLLFTDLANFTELSEGFDVQHLGQFMNRYLGEMSDQILAQDGTLDKYIGDAIMCFWNAPLPQADHAARACRSALSIAARERELYAEFSGSLNATGKAPRIFTRIGINTASAAVGFIGSDHLFNYTALGDGVNLASRLEGANKIYGTRILLSANTAALVKEEFWLRQVDVLRVKGKKEPMAVFELLAPRGTDDQRYQHLTQLYENAFAAYRARDWELSEKLLLELSRNFAQDGPGQALLARVREYRLHPPDSAWDGVYVSTTK